MRDCTRFLAKFAPSIVAKLSCFDRVIFKGYLPFGGDEHLNSWVDGRGLKRKDFLPLVERMSNQLVEQALGRRCVEQCSLSLLSGSCGQGAADR